MMKVMKRSYGASLHGYMEIYRIMTLFIFMPYKFKIISLWMYKRLNLFKRAQDENISFNNKRIILCCNKNNLVPFPCFDCK